MATTKYPSHKTGWIISAQRDTRGYVCVWLSNADDEIGVCIVASPKHGRLPTCYVEYSPKYLRKSTSDFLSGIVKRMKYYEKNIASHIENLRMFNRLNVGEVMRCACNAFGITSIRSVLGGDVCGDGIPEYVNNLVGIYDVGIV